jgi:hypothetical protein
MHQCQKRPNVEAKQTFEGEKETNLTLIYLRCAQESKETPNVEAKETC